MKMTTRFGWLLIGGCVMTGALVRAETPTPATGQETTVSTNAPAKPQTRCPVGGDKIDKKLFVDVEGYRVYLCCLDCARKVKADPKKYLKKIADAGEQAEPLKKDSAAGGTTTNAAAQAQEPAASQPATSGHEQHSHGGHQH